MKLVLSFIIAIVLFIAAKNSNANESTQHSGKLLYELNCIKCHNKDPRKPGPIGPDIAGSSLELITMKVKKLGYPKGYVPKRKTKIMPKIYIRTDQIKSIYLYLQEFKGKP